MSGTGPIANRAEPEFVGVAGLTIGRPAVCESSADPDEPGPAEPDGMGPDVPEADGIGPDGPAPGEKGPDGPEPDGLKPDEPAAPGAEPGEKGAAGANGDGAPDDGSAAVAAGPVGANGDRDI